MRDDRAHFFGADLSGLEFPVEATRDEDAPVRRGKTIHRVYLVKMHPHARQIERARQPVAHRLEPGIGQFGRACVKLARGAPNREAIHGDRIKQRQKDGHDLEHGSDMGRI